MILTTKVEETKNLIDMKENRKAEYEKLIQETAQKIQGVHQRVQQLQNQLQQK